MVLLESVKVPMGSEASGFLLEGIDGETYGLESFAKAKVLVLIFMCNHCPYVQAIWGRLNVLQDRFGSDGVQLVGINSNTANEDYSEETFDKMRQYALEYEMNFPYLEDKDQAVAREYKAQCTPDIYVYDSERKLAYHGRLDDNWKEESGVQKEELAGAVEALLGGERPAEEQKPAMGCSIKWV